MDQLRASLKQKILVKGYGGEYRGAQAKFWFDILEDENYSGIGNVIAYIAEVFMKVDKRTELSLPDLQEFIRSEKCRVLYNVIEQGETLNDKIGMIHNSQFFQCLVNKVGATSRWSFVRIPHVAA